MLKNKFIFISLLLLLALSGCAKRGSITGGLKDTLAPVLKVSFPKNYSTVFKGNEIKLTFDEYVKLKDANKQLIISPPMNTAPELTPSTASKYITIKIKDTLKPNTTYSFNFGQSISDNNEGNPYRQFKYIFSTGTFIDSLKLSGTIRDALNKKEDNFVSVMLYDVDEKYTDSTVYKSPPRYITNTLDSLKTFSLENLKAGKYLLVALKDENSNNLYNPKREKIAFHKEFISIPTDSTFELSLFKQVMPFYAFKPSQASGNRATLGYEGRPKDLKLVLKNQKEILPIILTKLKDKDSVQIWFKPLKVDSLSLGVSKDKFNKNFIFKIKNQKKDTLAISSKQTGTLNFREQFTLTSTVPLTKFDTTKIQFINKDSVAVAYKTEYDEWNQELKFDFQKEESEKYTIKLLPGALTDYLNHVNDTLSFNFNTRTPADYGNLRVKLENVKRFPIIIELTNTKGDLLASAYSEDKTTIDFNLLEPSLFTLRVIYDDNKNKEWDPGDFLEKRQSEEVHYFPKEIDVRANWDVEQVFNLSP